ncbi:MAG: hypothetical protein KatS3mg099_326 [Candidatus Parcubacteria bacterium]|nr:MAG: hypothetical protein KatS3mg099_326 [Candidatus Parcubacteria bacterium]
MASLAHSIPQTTPSHPFVENARGKEGRLEEVWVSSREAARVLGKTTDYIARLCREGALECRQDGRAWRVQAASMVRFSQRAREAKESIRQAKSERLRQWWEAQQWWKYSSQTSLGVKNHSCDRYHTFDRRRWVDDGGGFLQL